MTRKIGSGGAMRIGMAVLAYYGRDARVRRYAEALARRGYVVDVVALREPGSAKTETIAGVNVIKVPMGRQRRGALYYLFESGFFTLAAAWHLARRRYDVVHIHNMPDLLVFAALVPKLRRAAVVLDIHDLMPEVYQSKYEAGPDHGLVSAMRLEERISFRFPHAIIYSAQTFRDIAASRRSGVGKKGAVFINTADTALFDRNLHPWRGGGPEGVFRVLYLGTVSHRHGVDQAVAAVAGVRSRIPNIVFDIYPRFAAGEGEPLRRLQEQVAELGLDDVVRFLDPVPLDDVPAILAGADVGVFTPHVDAHIDIALSLKVPEMAAMAVPIVATRTAVMDTYFGDEGILFFDDGDIDACVEAIAWVHDNPAEAR
ncbi:MAG: glycosyltransferase, partial [Actinobacteria bacterium]